MEIPALEDKAELIYWGKRLYEKGMSPATSGNISFKTKQGILISATGVCLNDIQEDEIILIDYNGNVINGTKKPSGEKIMHTEIYTKRDDIGAVIHSHCPMITAFAVAGIPITKPIIPDFVVLDDEIPLIPYYCPASIELATVVGEYFEDYNIVLLKNHGVVVGADNLKNAFYKLETLRMYAETYFAAEVLGGAKPLKKKEIAEIKRLVRKD